MCILTSFAQGYGQTWEMRDILRADQQLVNDYFGTSVAINNEYAVVGGYTNGSNRKLPVYVYRLEDNTHTLSQIINGQEDEFPFVGYSLSITNEFLVIGDPGVGTYSSTHGAAYIYQPDNTGTWVQKQRITVNDDWQFGGSVNLLGNTLAVSSSGGVYIFEPDPVTGFWKEKQKLPTPVDQPNGAFGRSLAVGDDFVLVGAPGEDEVEFESLSHGAVYFFQKNESGVWEQKRRIIAPAQSNYAMFGNTLDIYNDELIIGAVGEEHYGAAYFYKLENGEWVLTQRIASPAENNFAHDVAIEGSHAVISCGNHLSQYSFTYTKGDDGQWYPGVKIYSPRFHVSYEAESFGKAIDLANGRLIIGAPDATATMYDDYNPPRAGEALIFQTSSIPFPFERANWLNEAAVGSFPNLIDFDNDGDLDLFASYYAGDTYETRLYRFSQDHDQYELLDQRFPPLQYDSDVEWLDMNGDGWQDFIMRYQENYNPKTEVYLNDHGQSFSPMDVSAQVFGHWKGRFNFADYDNDADLDLLVQLNVEPGDDEVVQLLINDGKFVFSKSDFIVNGVITSSQPWFDFNNDGFKDFVINEEISCDEHRMILYQNKGGEGFEKINTSINTLSTFFTPWSGDMVWGDYDNDGDGDMIWTGVTGCSTGDGESSVTINNGGVFSKGSIAFRELLGEVHLNLADLNSDGILDIVPYGVPPEGRREIAFFLGSGSAFEKLDLYEMPTPYQNGSATVGDIEGDGDVDVLIAGDVAIFTPRILVYKNNAADGWTKKNLPPSQPANFKAVLGERSVSLAWDASHDDTTPQKALTYNVVLMRNDSVIFNSFSNSNGGRQHYQAGNVGFRRQYQLRNLKDGQYKVAVQAIDNSYAGSMFTTMTEFEISETILALEEFTEGEVLAFPNPTNDKVTIESRSGDIRQVELCDVLGRRLYIKRNGWSARCELDFSSLQPSVYFVTVQTQEGSVVKRIVKK